MCGILGQFKFKKDDKSLIDLKAGLYSIIHRGPDSLSFYQKNNVSLGHVRLSVIDISENANQPFFSSDNQHTLIFNGEIFNFLELKAELEALGIQFRTKSDTEVLLQYIILNGSNALAKLNGFYALAYVDLKSNSGFIARDAMGIKPLVYEVSDSGISFASSSKALVKAINYPNIQIDQEAVGQYMRFNYIPSPRTIYSNIKKLEPGACISFNSNGIIQESKSEKKTSPAIKKWDNIETDLMELLDDSVRLRLQSDVPIGSFLSGGIDSSIIAALASKQIPNFKTFSIGFPDASIFDESRDAEALALRLKTDHKTIRITENDLVSSVDELIKTLDEPFADSSSIAVYNLCKAVRQDVTVALSGDGADELFGGYNKHKALFLSLHPNAKSRALKILSPILPSSGNRESIWNNKLRQISKFNKGLKLKPTERYIQWASFCDTEAIQRLLDNDSSSFKPLIQTPFNGNFSDFLKMDQELVLANDMLVKVDQMSMANSLEVRVPFLDKRIVEFARQLPNKYLNNGRKGKLILRNAFKDLLPNDIFQRPKHGFEVPLKSWLNGPLKEDVDTFLSSQVVDDFGLFKFQEVDKILKKSRSKQSGDSIYQVWAIYVMHKWLEIND